MKLIFSYLAKKNNHIAARINSKYGSMRVNSRNENLFPFAQDSSSIYLCTYVFSLVQVWRKEKSIHLPNLITHRYNYHINRIHTRHPIIVTIYYCKCYLHMYLNFKQFHKVFLFSFFFCLYNEQEVNLLAAIISLIV